MNYFLGLLTTIFSVLIALTFMWLFDFQFHSLFVLFIFPAGATAFGFISSYGYFLKKKRTSVIIKRDYCIGALFGLISLGLIFYSEYLFTYISDDGLLNYRFNGIHISELVNYSGQSIGFFDYISYKLEGSEIQIKPRRGGTFQDSGIQLGTTLTTLRFIIQCIGFIIGSMAFGFIINSDSMKCQSCGNSYLKKYKLLKLNNLDKYEILLAKIIKAIETDNSRQFVDLIIEERIQSQEYIRDKMEFLLNTGICTKCNSGFIISKVFLLDSNGNFEELKEHRMIFKVSRNFVENTSRALKAS